eukprot:3936705-Rhodomonas_salina.1
MLLFAGHEQKETTPLYEDNEAALKLSENPIARSMTKHIARRFHFLRQCNNDRHLALIRVESSNNTADAMTKPLGIDAFERHRRGMGVAVCGMTEAFAAFVCGGAEHRKILSRQNPYRRCMMWEYDARSWQRSACGSLLHSAPDY